MYRHAARAAADPPAPDFGRYVSLRSSAASTKRRKSKSDIAADGEAASALTPLRLELDERDLVPWGMAAGPDGSLYVAVDVSYRARPSCSGCRVGRSGLYELGVVTGHVCCAQIACQATAGVWRCMTACGLLLRAASAREQTCTAALQSISWMLHGGSVLPAAG